MIKISISIVSHIQIGMVQDLLVDLEQFCSGYQLEVLLTLNVPEVLPFFVDDFSFPILIYVNSAPMGFAANHNQAYLKSRGEFFCVMNPDIRFNCDPFHALLGCLQEAKIGVVAPVVINRNGEVDDSARRFPSPLKILCKAFGGCKGSDYLVEGALVYPDWVGGMFMLFPRDVFALLRGFDQRYFLYYEDVDICGRLRLNDLEVVMCPQAKAIHNAQRSSHRNIVYMRLHLRSMMRFFLSTVYWRLLFRRSR